MSREAKRRAEDQYLDLVDFITNHPNTPITAADYVAWPRRNQSVEWGPVAHLYEPIRSRLEQLALSVTLPYRPDVPAPSRNAVWLAALLAHEGTFYRVRRGVYVLDTAARWRRTARGVVLDGNRWTHTPAARVKAAMPTNTPRMSDPVTPQTPPTTPVPVREDPPTAEADATDERLFVPRVTVKVKPTYTVQAAGPNTGDQIVLRRVDLDGSATLLLATINSVIEEVTS